MSEHAETGESHRKNFLEGMSKAACTVNIVTTDGESGRAGLTVSAMSSVSADPASLLICVNAQSRSCSIISENKVFCVNVLNDSQASISDIFSSPKTVDEKFDSAQWRKETTGAPILDDALTYFDCRLQHSFQFGSHVIFVGEVVGIGVNESGNPLIYANRAYGKTIQLQESQRGPRRKNGNGASLRIGGYLNTCAFFMPGLFASYSNENPSDDLEIFEGSQVELLDMLRSDELDVAIMYKSADYEGLETEILFEAPPYVMLAADHPFGGRSSITSDDLKKYRPIVLESPSSGKDYLANVYNKAGLSIDDALRTASYEVLRGMVAHGLGYAITFTKPACSMSYDGAELVLLPYHGEFEAEQLVMLHKPYNALDDRQIALVRFCREFFDSR